MMRGATDALSICREEIAARMAAAGEVSEAGQIKQPAHNELHRNWVHEGLLDL